MNYRAAMGSAEVEQWERAISEELLNHNKYQTWVLVDRKQAQGKILSSGWTFNVKLDQGGEQLRYKARLYVRGCQQTTDQYDATTAPVTTMLLLRLLLHRAVTRNAKVLHADVKAAYLNAPLEEELYMYVPDGVEARADQVCKLQKSLYGLKQSGANWHAVISEWLLANGFKNCETDPCAYILKGSGDGEVVLTLYVDDMLIVSESDDLLKSVLDKMQAQFTVKVTDLRVYLAQRITFGSGRVSIDMATYARDMVDQFGLRHANATTVPCIKGSKAISSKSQPVDDKAYRMTVGRLQWLAQTRPDLTFTLHRLSSAAKNPQPHDVAAVKHAMRYLVGSWDRGIVMKCGGELVGYVDADWATDEEDRKSVSGYVVGFLHENGTLSPLLWRTRKQTCVADSTYESEYIACHDVCKELTYVQQLMGELGWKTSTPTRVFCDNRAAVLIGNDDARRTKHARYVDIRFHYARHCQREGRVKFVDIASAVNIADVFTKALGRVKFEGFANRITEHITVSSVSNATG